MTAKIGIAGAGLLGRLVALRLVHAGYDVTLFDKDSREGTASCGWAGAGMLSPYAELEKAETVVADLGRDSLRLWPKVMAQLSQPVFFQQNGSVVVAHRQDLADLERFKRQVAGRLNEPERMQALDAAGLADLEPELANRFGRAVYFEDEAQLEPHDLMPALHQALIEADVTWHAGATVVEMRSYQLRCSTTWFRFDWVLDCRGLGAAPEWQDLRGVRGELIRVVAPDVQLARPVRLMHPRYPLYIVPRPNNVYLVGATAIESNDMRPVTVKSCLELLSAAYSLHPGFAEAHILEASVNCRPALPDNQPHLHVSPGLIRANGLYRHGYLTAPAVAEEIFRLLNDQPLHYPDLSEVTHVDTARKR